MTQLTRRSLMATTAGLGFLPTVVPGLGTALLAGLVSNPAQAGKDRLEFLRPPASSPYPLSQVRLLPSVFLTSIQANGRYLASLDADRLLHNFRKGAGLVPKAEPYGGWEARGIAGHSLGHYLSAVSLMFAQTGDTAWQTRAQYVVSELSLIQRAHGDGYAGGTTVDRDGATIDGKVVYEELRRGDIRTSGFDLNGGWVPFYAYHKVLAGALNAHWLVGSNEALSVATGLGGYLGRIIEGLSDDQVQEILRAEHGGLIESYCDLFERTRNPRWLHLARRFWHKAILDPLAEGRDELAGKHANTQIPKVIGAQALFSWSGDPKAGRAAHFFWNAVTRDHSYVIGGNSDHEHFSAPRRFASRLVQETCEACNTYNMLRLTRQLYGQTGDPALFDYYERAHLNHIMSQQDPETGMFSYFTPLASGFSRLHSEPEASFWCCVGSGMESHSKHGDSIYWKSGERTLINLYYPSRLDAPDVALTLQTRFPEDGDIRIEIDRGPGELGLRIPSWCSSASLSVNGRSQGDRQGDYLVLTNLKPGDVVSLSLPMEIRSETLPDDARMTAFLSGPLVLAADVGPADQPFDGIDPVIVSNQTDGLLERQPGSAQRFAIGTRSQPSDLVLTPFFSQHRNRTAVYFRRYTSEEWLAAEPRLRSEAANRAAVRAATIDVIRLGQQQPEVDRGFVGTANTATVDHIRDGGRWIQAGFFEFDLAVSDDPINLEVVYAGRDRAKDFRILVNGQLLVRETLDGDATSGRQIRTYPLSRDLTRNRDKIRVRFEADQDQWATAFEARTFLRSSEIH